ncbi:MAG: hypothetical protein ACJAU0_002566 [Flavobacteriales bacterium]|jgi:hypothetical protein
MNWTEATSGIKIVNKGISIAGKLMKKNSLNHAGIELLEIRDS